MVSGYICLVLLILLACRGIVRKMGWKKADLYLGKFHKPLGVCIVLIAAFHLIMTLSVWKTRWILVVISGIITMVVMVAFVAMYLFRKRNPKRWMHYHRVGTLVLVACLAIHMAVYFVDLGRYMGAVQNISIQGVSATGIKDGDYVGQYDVGYIYAKVNVSVRDELITNVEIITHNNERGAKAEEITNRILEKQTSKVDSISGATNSSKVIKKAVENALMNAEKRK